MKELSFLPVILPTIGTSLLGNSTSTFILTDVGDNFAGNTLPDLPAEVAFKFNEAGMIVGLDDRSNERA